MAEQIISPGVFTRENDLSYLPAGIGAIGAAIVGPTVKGPAFVPTLITSFSDFERKFGSLSNDTFVPKTVQEYITYAGAITVCRVLAGGGYTYANGTNEFIALGASGSSGNVLVGVIAPSKATGTPDLSTSTFEQNLAKDTGSFDGSFRLTLTGSGVTGETISASLGPDNSDYLFDNIGTDPNNSKTGAVTYAGTPGYGYINFEQLQSDILSSTTNEVSQLTFAAAPPTASLEIAHSSASIVISTSDINSVSTAYTLVFSGSGGLNVIPAANMTTGSIVYMDMHNGGTGTIATTDVITIAELTASLITAVNNSVPGFSATAGSSAGVVNISNMNAGATTDISLKSLTAGSTGNYGTQTTLTGNTASISVTTEGADLSGYVGIHADSRPVFANQSSDLVFSGHTLSQTEGYSHASTPWITSQYVGGAHPNKTTKNLFKVHTIAHGTSCNLDYKISIINQSNQADIDGVEQYSTFGLQLRKYNDTDTSKTLIEEYYNLNLDPDSVNYIGRQIGDKYPLYNDSLGKVEILGNYPNASALIRVEMADAVESKATSKKLLPKGFAALYNPIATASLNVNMVFPSASYEGVQELGSIQDDNAYLGWKFNDKRKDNENFLKPIPATLESNVAGAFQVEDYFVHASSSEASDFAEGSLSASIDSTGASGPTSAELKFSIPFQGGDDGIAPYKVRFTGAESSLASTYTAGTNLFGFDVSSTTKAGYIGYKKALDILENQDEYDINMLAIPGINKQYHNAVTNKAIKMVEARGDTFYVMDLVGKSATVNTAINTVSGLDSSYAAVYYPWVKVTNSAGIDKLVPPSVVIPGAIAKSDNIGQGEWFAPAGLNRGILNVSGLKINLNQSERDRLYKEKINPIANFPTAGPCIWGQKTLQTRTTALNRINVRRLLIAVKKYIASSSKYLVFEQNTIQTRDRFLNIVNPYLEAIQQKQGLYSFRVIMDESNNTPDVIDRNQLLGAIYLQPTKTAEFIVLDFNVLPTGATFPA